MTIILPSYARSKVGYFIWKTDRKIRQYLHGRKRNPDCNERRRYRDDVKFTSGKHRHAAPLWGTHPETGERIKFDTVAVEVRPFKLGPLTKEISKEDLMYLNINPVGSNG